MLVIVAMRIPRMLQAEQDGAILLGAVHHPKPHGGTEDFSGEAVRKAGSVRVETSHDGVKN